MKSLIKHPLTIFLFLSLSGTATSVFLKEYQSVEIAPNNINVIAHIILAIGLYGSVFPIHIDEVKKNATTIVSAITIGVLVKATLISSVLFNITGNPLAFLFGIIVAQIDPVSVSYLLETKTTQRLSRKAENILRAWSSFDDPMTVLLSLYVALPLLQSHLEQAVVKLDFSTYFKELGINLIFALFIYLLSKLFKKYNSPQHSEIILLLISFGIAIVGKLFLGIALVGLFLRPNIEEILESLVAISFYISTFILGLLLINGISLAEGFFLASLAVIAQVTSSFVLARNFSITDKIYLSFGQQNGITSIILSLIIESYYPGTIAVVAPAIFYINCMYYGLNAYADYVFKNKETKTL